MNSLPIPTISYLGSNNGYNISLVFLLLPELKAFDVCPPQAINQFITSLLGLYLLYKHDDPPKGGVFINLMQTSWACYNYNLLYYSLIIGICTESVLT